MNRDLTRLKDWATSMAATDPDIPARALWSQIAAEGSTPTCRHRRRIRPLRTGRACLTARPRSDRHKGRRRHSPPLQRPTRLPPLRD